MIDQTNSTFNLTRSPYLFCIVYFNTRHKTAQHSKLISCETSALANRVAS
uniref:Uncharacterized protein n=1 Tax=Meloidogyne enterolobii TaxID=390850 RepID=A0A6V7WI23_MELEN|nr:unnamed protein product [Meloidogyne enterolobii]